MVLKFPKSIRFASRIDGELFRKDQVAMLPEFLKQALKISFEIVYPEDNTAGIKLQNGSWTGLFGMMQSGKADITYNLIATEEETDVIDFSAAYAFDDVTFITNKPTNEHIFFAFIRPFSVNLWIAILILYISMSLLFYKFLREKRSFLYLLVDMFGSFLNQSYYYDSRRKSKKMLFMSWMLGVFFITASYQATLLSFLTIPSLDGVRTIQELATAVQTKKYICKTHSNHIFIKMFRESADENMRIIGNSMFEHNGIHLDMDQFLTKYEAAFIGGKRLLNPHKNKYYISRDSFFSLGAYFGFRKEFCCNSRVNEVVMRIFETGIYDKFWRGNNNLKPKNNNTSTVEESDDASPLNLKDVEEVFYLLLFGYVLSIFVFIVEKQMYKKSRLIHRKLKQNIQNPLRKQFHRKTRLRHGNFQRQIHTNLKKILIK